MYVFSNSTTNAAVLNSIDNFKLQARITGTVNGISFTDANIVGGSFSITNQCSSETELSIGQVYVGELNISLTGLTIDRYSLYGKRIIPTYGIYVNSAWRNIPLGTFIISEVEVTNKGIDIRAYDNMSLFDVPFEATSLSGTPRNLAVAACNACGLTLATTATQFNAFVNHGVTLTATQTTDSEGNNSIPQFSTYRDVIAAIAQVSCCNVLINRSGEVVFQPYPSTAVATIDISHRMAGGMTADYETYYDSILYTDPATKKQTKYSRSNPSGLTMDLGDNPLINTAAVRNAILNGLTFRFHPFRMNVLNAPLYDLMDCIYLPDGIGDGTKLYCITKYTWTYHGSYQLVGAGQDPKLVSVVSAAQKSAARANFIASQKVDSTEMENAINAATAQITGNNGGYVVLHDSNNDGEPDELLVMNTPSINTATKVWRFNLNGLGHSNNGYNGTYGLALTADGAIVANKVTVGTLGDLAGKNYWNMETGDISISAAGNIDTITTYYAESYENVPPQWDAPTAYLLDADGKALYDADGNRLRAKSIWNTTRPTTVSSMYRWMRQYIVYTDGSTALTDASPMQDYYGRANLVMQASTDANGTPIGVMSGLADYIKFTAGQLEISSPQFTLDRDGNATFAGMITASQVKTGSMISTNGMATVDLDNAEIYVTDSTYRRAMLRGDAGALILLHSTNSGSTYTEVGSLWVNNSNSRSIANIDTIQVGRYQAAPTAQLRANQAIAEWNYSDNEAYLSANRIRIRATDGSALYPVLTWDTTESTPGTKLTTDYAEVTKITGQSYWGSNGEVIHYSATGGNVLRAISFQAGTESTNQTAISWDATNSMVDVRAGVFKLRNSGTLYSVLSWDSTNSGTKVTTSYGSITNLTSTNITGTKYIGNSYWGSNGEVMHYTSSGGNNLFRAYQYQIGTEADHKTLASFTSGSVSVSASSFSATGSYSIDAGGTSKTIIGKLTDNTTYIKIDDFYLGGNSTAVGTFKTASGSTTSLPNNTATNVCSISLTKGLWLVNAQFNMPVATGDSGRVYVSISTASATLAYSAYTNVAVNGAAQAAYATNLTRILEVTGSSATVYMVANQTTGASKTLTTSRIVLNAICIK